MAAWLLCPRDMLSPRNAKQNKTCHLDLRCTSIYPPPPPVPSLCECTLREWSQLLPIAWILVPVSSPEAFSPQCRDPCLGVPPPDCVPVAVIVICHRLGSTLTLTGLYQKLFKPFLFPKKQVQGNQALRESGGKKEGRATGKQKQNPGKML